MNLMNRKTNINLCRSPADEGSQGASGDDTVTAGDDTVSTGDDTVAASDDKLPAGFDIEKAPKDFVGEDGNFDFEGFFAKYDETVAAKAIADEARAEVPESPDGYEFAVPEDIDFGELNLPEGFKVEFDMENPVYKGLFEDAGKVMHELGLPKSATGKFTGLIAKMEAAKYSQAFTAHEKEFNELGDADTRIKNLERMIDGKLPEKEAEALKTTLMTADGIRAMEKLLAPRRMGSGDPVPPTRDPDKMLADYYSKPTR